MREKVVAYVKLFGANPYLNGWGNMPKLKRQESMAYNLRIQMRYAFFTVTRYISV